MNKRFFSLFLLFIGLLVIAAGCARPLSRCNSPEDNPPHHYTRGMDLLEKDKVNDASAKFERALYCNEEYSPAYAGMSLVYANKAKAKNDPGYRQVDSDNSFDNLKKAWKYVDSKEDKFAYYLASMRVFTALKVKKWLNKTEDSYTDAMKLKVDEKQVIYYDGREAVPYFMGVAYLQARKFQEARNRFSDVLNMKRESKWHELADKGWKRADKIVRAMAGITLGEVGLEIATRDSVSRGDMAALLIDEMKIDKLFAGRIPVKSEIEKNQTEFIPADMLKHHFKDEVLTILQWGIRGLEPQHDQNTQAFLFKPDDAISRKEFALVLEDILAKLTGDEGIYTAYFGQERSPFPDVQATVSWYNAVMNVVTRNLMETELSGEFRPNDPVDGAEAILALRVLRQRINIY